MSFTIRNKLILGYASLLVLMALGAGTGTYSIFSLKRDAHEATAVGGRLNSIAIEIQVHNLEAQRRMKSYLGEADKSGPAKTRATYLEEADFEIHEIETLAAKAIRISPTSEEKAKFEKVAASLGAYKQALAAAIKVTETGGNGAARTASVEKYEAAADALHDDAEDGEVTGREASEASENHIAKTSDHAEWLSIVISLMGLAVGIGMSIALLRGILRPVNHLKEVAESVSLGNLDIAVRRYSNDEIGDLADSFSRMVAAVKFFRAESEDALATMVLEKGLEGSK